MSTATAKKQSSNSMLLGDHASAVLHNVTTPMIGIRARNLKLRMNRKTLLQVKALDCPPSQATCLVGANGSGKSLLLETLCGLYDYSGTVEYMDERGSQPPPAITGAMKVGALLQRFRLWSHATVAEILELVDKVTGSRIPRDAILQRIASQQYRRLSTGERQYLLFAISISPEMSCCFLDEPMLGLDASLHEKAIERIRIDPRTRVVCLHNFSDVLAIADRCYLMVEGVAMELQVQQVDSGAPAVFVVEGKKTELRRHLNLSSPRSVELLNQQILPTISEVGSDFADTPPKLKLQIRCDEYERILSD